MNSKINSFLMMAAVMGLPPLIPDSFYDQEIKYDSDANWHKKCFNPECTNKRSGNRLYCSADCFKKHKQIIKNENR